MAITKHSLIFLIPVAGLLLSGCSNEATPVAEAKQAPIAAPKQDPGQLQACKAVKRAIIEEMQAPADSTFGPCDALWNDVTKDYTVGVAINVPHVDEHGVSKPDTFYYADAKQDPATGQWRGSGLVHN